MGIGPTVPISFALSFISGRELMDFIRLINAWGLHIVLRNIIGSPFAMVERSAET